MDPRTALITATILMLLNGGVLGLLHRTLSRETQASAADWRIGTLLVAGGTILLSVQDIGPVEFLLPVANGCLLVGLSLYWRAIRRFCGRPDTWLVFLPSALGTFGIYWFVAIEPSFNARVAIASPVSALMLCACAWTLLRARGSGTVESRYVLTGILLFIGFFLLGRGIYFGLGLANTPGMLDRDELINAITSLIYICLPVIGTTAFLLMCTERLRRQWEQAATTDELTGLPNRRSIMQAAEARFAAARRGHSPMAVAVIDIDHFKQINDRFGHDVGDRALKQVADALDTTCRGPHMVGRQGGEEFVALLEGADEAAALAAGERLRAAVAATPLAVNGTVHPLTISIGIGNRRQADTGFENILQRADAALYRAKHAGRNRVEAEAG